MPADLSDFSGKIYKIVYIIVFDSPTKPSGSGSTVSFLDFIKYLYDKFLSNPKNNLADLKTIEYDCLTM